MEKMPYQSTLDTHMTPSTQATVAQTQRDVVWSDWRSGLPVLAGDQVVLRELRTSDAASLFSLLTTEEVARFISPPPTTVEGFERFIAWTHRQRAAGVYVCYAVTLKRYDTAIGIFQVRETEQGFSTGEWGFALGSPFWGTGVFAESADLVLEFVFETVGVHRLEARAAVRNGRGGAALRKVGAVQEGVLRKSLLKNGEYLDQALYGIVEDDWRAARRPERAERPSVNIH